MNKKKMAREIVLWILTLILALVCLRAGLMKLPGVPGEQFWARDFLRWGYPGWFKVVVGIAELSSFVLLLLPRLAGYGAAVFGLVMVGAMWTHGTHDESIRLPFNLFLLMVSLVIVVARRPGWLNKFGKSERA